MISVAYAEPADTEAITVTNACSLIYPTNNHFHALKVGGRIQTYIEWSRIEAPLVRQNFR